MVRHNVFYGSGLMVFVAGLAFFIVGAYLVQELIFKFLKFAVGLFLIFISIPMILGGLGWGRFVRRGKVVRMN
ncbi:MAG: hypothetical protein V1729_02025 [Candidatus Woesearchaeota archaeon]